MRLGSFSLRCTVGLTEGFDTLDLKEARALLEDLAALSPYRFNAKEFGLEFLGNETARLHQPARRGHGAMPVLDFPSSSSWERQ